MVNSQNSSITPQTFHSQRPENIESVVLNLRESTLLKGFGLGETFYVEGNEYDEMVESR